MRSFILSAASGPFKLAPADSFFVFSNTKYYKNYGLAENLMFIIY